MKPAATLRNSLVLVITLTSMCPAANDSEGEIFFERHVRPILVRHCVSCHGPEVQESNLRLDHRDGVLRGGDLGPAVIPGKPQQSRLVQAIRYRGELRMPPVKALSQPDVGVLEKWVRDGAVWPATSTSLTNDRSLAQQARELWSLQPISNPAIPVVGGSVENPIDAFVLERLEHKGLTHAPSADRRILLRRLAVDLLGRLPELEELREFERDDRPDAWSRQVDRMLSAPEYGERWARFWLDIARYADDKGYVFFEDQNYPWAWTYRDYVIRAWNADKPFDDFVREQLAADQLALADPADRAAMGFLTIGGHFMNNTHDMIDDRIDVISRGLMGLTLTCARCHDHKYDPLTQADYYALYGVLRSSDEPVVPPLLDPPPNTAEYREFEAELTNRSERLDEFVAQRFRRLTDGARRRVDEYLMAAHQRRNQPSTEDFMLIADPDDVNPTMVVRWQKYLELVGDTHPVWGLWKRLEEVPDDEFPHALTALREDASGEPKSVFNRAVQVIVTDVTVTDRSILAKRYGELFRQVDTLWHEQLTADPASERLADPADEQVRRELYAAGTPPQIPPTLGWGFLSLFPDRQTQNEYKKLLKDVETWLVSEHAPARAMVLVDREQPFEPQIFERGNPHRPGQPVRRRFVEVIDSTGEPFQHGSGRAELAERIVDASNPLTARVIVNRVWQHHFGVGLVPTPSDFGSRSEPPSHPELLDYLARQLIRHDWSIKWLHRQILTSNTYRQSSLAEGSGSDQDPQNRLLWRMNRRRLEFEALRDALLSVSRRLDGRMFGPAVNVLEPNAPRRTVYSRIDRMDVPTLLTTFDFPNPAATSAQRETTTVAPQALFLWNHPFVIQCARDLGSRVRQSTNELDQQLDQIYLILFQRPPTNEERTIARRLLTSPASESPASETAERWTLLAHTLLLTNEFLFID